MEKTMTDKEKIYPYSEKKLLKQVDVRLILKDGPALYSGESIESPIDAVKIMREVLSGLDREWLCVINMDTKLRPVNYNVVSIGSLNESLANIQNIIKSAILSNCDNILLMHNHPSGAVTPSTADDTVTRHLIQACKLMDMHLLDHIIVGGGSGKLYSFFENNRYIFDEPIDNEYLNKIIDLKDKSVAEDEDSYEVVYPRRHHR